MRKHTWITRIVIIGLTALLLASCGAQPTPDLNLIATQLAGTIYAELTATALAQPTATATVEPTQTPIPPTPETQPTATIAAPTQAGVSPYVVSTGPDDAKFTADITIPDGSVVDPGDMFDKTWQFENTGTTTWTRAYTLRYVEGNLLGRDGTTSDNLTTDVKPGKLGELTILFTAPKDPGTYYSTWKLYNSEGVPFGEYVTINITVR